MGKVDMTQIVRVEAFTLRRGALQLNLTTHGKTTDALARLAPGAGGVTKEVKTPLMPPPAMDGQLQFANASGVVLATILLHEVSVASFARSSPLGPTGALTPIGHASLVAKQATLAFAPQIAQ
jgi:hypothetical protein